MGRKLTLNRDQVDRSLDLARKLVGNAYKYIDRHSTVAVEAVALEWLGVTGEIQGRPIAARLVERLTRDQQRFGAAAWFGRGLKQTGLHPPELATKLLSGDLSYEGFAPLGFDELRRVTLPLAETSLRRLQEVAQRRGQRGRWRTRPPGPQIGSPTPHDTNVDPSPLRFWHAALSDGSDCVIGDASVGSLRQGYDPRRLLIDQSVAYQIAGIAGLSVQTTDWGLAKMPLDLYRDADQLLIALFMSEQLAFAAKFPAEKLTLTHPMVLSTGEHPLLHGLALAQLIREIFHKTSLAYVLPEAQQAELSTFGWIGVLSDQPELQIETSDASTEASLAQFVQGSQALTDEWQPVANGQLERRAHYLLDRAWHHLQRLEPVGWVKALSSGELFGLPAREGDGLGFDGVFQKERGYWNPMGEVLNRDAFSSLVGDEGVAPLGDSEVGPADGTLLSAPARMGCRPDVRRGRAGGRNRQRATQRRHSRSPYRATRR